MSNIKDNLLKYKIYFIFKWYHFLAPVLMIYILSFDLSLLKATITISTVFYLMGFLFEIPSGIFADLYGRKKTLILASFLLLAGILLFSFGSSFPVFLLAGIFWGIGMAFDSGATDALLYDTLLELKREEEFKKIKGNILFYTYLALAISSLVSSFLYTINPRLPFYLASISVGIAFLTSLTFREPKYHKSRGDFNKHFKKSMKLIYNSKDLMWITVYSIVLLQSIFMFTTNFAQPYLISSGMKIIYFGILFASFRVFSSIGAKCSDKLEKFLSMKKLLFLLIISLGAVFFGLGFYIKIYSFIFILIMYFILGASGPIIDDFINKRVKSSHRATVFSIIILFGSLFNMIFGVMIAYIIELISLSTALYLIFGVILSAIIWLYFAYKN
jgi:MFS family permease